MEIKEKKVQLTFNEELHRYSDETGLVYTSVTTLIGKYKEPFNKKYWSMYTTLRDAGFKVRPTKDKKGIVVNGKYNDLDSLYRNPINHYEVKQMIDKWQKLTEAACDRGNEVHDFLEDNINISKGDEEGKSNDKIVPQLTETTISSNTGLDVIIKTQHDLDKTEIKDRFPDIYYRLKAYIDLGCVIFAEKKIYSTVYQIAGMIDVLIVNLRTKVFSILDWKTNKDVMMFMAGYFKKQKVGNDWVKTDNFIPTNKKLKYPLNNVDECKGMIYTLQLSLYAYIMELWGFTLAKNGLEIFHIRPNITPKLIKIAYKKVEIQKMLEHHYKKNILKLPSENSKENITFGIYGK